MNKIIRILILFSFGNANAQSDYWVGDTAFIKKYPLYGNDTNYRLKKEPDSGTYTIYFDQSHTLPAYTRTTFGKDRYNSQSWYSNGFPKEKETNIDSLPFYDKDFEKWYPDGKMQLSSKITRDSLITFNWFPNGQLAYAKRLGFGIPWRMETLKGSQWNWNEDGIIYEIDKFYPDSTIQNYVYPSGKLRTISTCYPDKNAPGGSRCRYMESYYENGQIQYTPIYPEKGKQSVIYYDSTGTKSEEGDWLNGKIGPYKEYYHNGKIKAEGDYFVREKHFISSTIINYCPVKSGIWKYYNESGMLYRLELYEGLKFKYEEYDEAGKVIKSGEESFHAYSCE